METSSEKYYPSLHLSSDDFPEIKRWKVGGKYKVLLEIEERSMSKDRKGVSASFDIKKIDSNNSETPKKRYKVLFSK